MSAPEKIWIDGAVAGYGMTAHTKPEDCLSPHGPYRRADLPPTDAEVKELEEAATDCIDRFVAAFPASENYEPIKRLRAALAAIQEAKP